MQIYPNKIVFFESFVSQFLHPILFKAKSFMYFLFINNETVDAKQEVSLKLQTR